jgi:hypothetical protein
LVHQATLPEDSRYILPRMDVIGVEFVGKMVDDDFEANVAEVQPHLSKDGRGTANMLSRVGLSHEGSEDRSET